MATYTFLDCRLTLADKITGRMLSAYIAKSRKDTEDFAEKICAVISAGVESGIVAELSFTPTPDEDARVLVWASNLITERVNELLEVPKV